MSERDKKGGRKLRPNLDPSMEQATEQLIRIVVLARDTGMKPKKEQTEAMEELCRFLRAKKVLLRECMESYPAYYDHFEAFVDYAVEGCALAEAFDAPQSLRISLNRHSSEIESLRSKYKELHANNDSEENVGESFQGATIEKKSRPKQNDITSAGSANQFGAMA